MRPARCPSVRPEGNLPSVALGSRDVLFPNVRPCGSTMYSSRIARASSSAQREIIVEGSGAQIRIRIARAAISRVVAGELCPASMYLVVIRCSCSIRVTTTTYSFLISGHWYCCTPAIGEGASCHGLSNLEGWVRAMKLSSFCLGTRKRAAKSLASHSISGSSRSGRSLNMSESAWNPSPLRTCVNSWSSVCQNQSIRSKRSERATTGSDLLSQKQAPCAFALGRCFTITNRTPAAASVGATRRVSSGATRN